MTGIHITSIVSPEQGWLIAMHCPICKQTVFALDIYGVKPSDGDYFRLDGVCADEHQGAAHTMLMTLDKMFIDILRFPISPKSIMGFDPREDNL